MKNLGQAQAAYHALVTTLLPACLAQNTCHHASSADLSLLCLREGMWFGSMHYMSGRFLHACADQDMFHWGMLQGRPVDDTAVPASALKQEPFVQTGAPASD